MVVLETAIVFENETLLEKSFYDTTKILDKTARSNLVSAISVMADETFNENLESFSLGDHLLITISREVSALDDPNRRGVIKMYSIIKDESNEKAVRRCMNIAINQFLDRYPLAHILTKNTEMFKRHFPSPAEKGL